MADRIGIGIIGAGAISRTRHVPGFKAIPGVELVGVANRSLEFVGPGGRRARLRADLRQLGRPAR